MKLYKHKWWALLGISLLAFTGFLDVTIVNTALPFIQTALNASIIQLQWVTSVFAVVLGMTMIAVGKLADLLGNKKVFYFGVIAFTVAAYGAGFSSTIESLIAFRSLQALGTSVIFIASAALLTDVFPENERVRAIGIYGGITGFGLMAGPFLGGLLVAFLGWRWIFWINLPLIAIGLTSCFFSLKHHDHEKPNTQIDWWGLFFLIFGLGSLMYGIIAGAQYEWKSPLAWTLLGLGLVALVLLVILDERRKNPLFNFHLFKPKVIQLSALSCSLAGVASTVFMFFDPLYLRILRNLDPLQIGLLVAIIPAAQALMSLVFAKAVRKWGTSNLLFFSITAAVAAICLHRCITPTISLSFLALPFFLLGINWGLSNAASITAVNETIPKRYIGEALGIISTIWNSVGALMLASSTAIFYAFQKGDEFLSPFHHVVEYNIVFGILLLLVAIGIKKNRQIKHKN